MSKDCGFVVNGQKSPLYDKILKAYNGIEELATPLHSYFRTNEKFLKDFGNWVEDYGVRPEYYDYKPGESRIEENGEPKLFKNEKNGNYYYIDKDKNKVEVIENTLSLSTIFSVKEISRITDVLVANFTKEELKLDFENIDLNEKASTIRESIVKKLNEKIDTFYKSGSEHFEDIAWSLETALDSHLDELVKNVVTALEVMKIKSSEKFNNNEKDSDLTEIEDNENQRDPGFGKAFYEMSTKGNVSANTKLRLSLIPDLNAKDNFLNDTVYLTFDEVYASLLPYLTNQVAIEKDGKLEDKFELMKSVILAMSEKKKYFIDLYNLLNKPGLNENIKNEFTQAFNLDMNNFNTSEYSYEESKDESTWVKLEDGTVIKPKLKTFKNINVSETGKKETDVFNEWNKNFKQYFVTETKDSTFINSEAKDRLKLINQKLNKIEFGKNNSVEQVIDILRKLGIENTIEGFYHFLDDFKLVNNDNELFQEKFNLLKNDLNFLITRIVNDVNTKFDDILSDQSIVKQLSKAEAFYISEGSDASVFTGGKQKWVFSYPSYLSNTIKAWKKDRNILLKHYQVSKYNEGSDWMKYLLALGDTYQVNEFESEDVQEQQRIEESKKRINNLNIYTFNTSQEEGKSIEGKTGKDISKSEYISDTMNKILGFKTGKKAYYRTTSPADKQTQLEIAINRFFESNARYDENGNVVLNDEIYELIYNYFDSEYKRMGFEREFMRDPNNADKLRIYYHTDAKGRVGMHFNPINSERTYFDNLAEYEAYNVEGTKQLLGHAFESQLFPSLSPGEIKKTLKNSDLKFENIYDANGYAYLSTSDNAGFKQLIKEYIKDELSKGVEKTLNDLIKNQIFNQTSGGITNIELDSKVWDSYQSDNALKASADFYINSLVSHIEYSKMFSGDVAYYKNAVDYKKRVPATYTDGLYQRLNDANKEYNIAVISSINISEPFLAELIELLGEELANKYKDDVNAADAQAWITPKRWKDLMTSMGKWNDTYESAYSKLIGENSEPFTEKELKAVAPPVKGVYFQIVNGVPIFLKYSQAVLSPRLRKGNGLEKIYNQMVNNKDENGNSNPIDELVTFDAIKVGSNLPVTIHNVDGSLQDNFEFKPFTIPSNGWKLQQDLPVKLMHDTDVGSQIQKNIFQGLAFNLDKMFTLDIPNKTTIIVSKEQSENIDNVWNENAELKGIFKNNKSLYQEYLNSIFPDSQVKDIVYHGTNKEFDKFKKPSDVGSQNRMIAFADDIEYAKIAGARRTSLKKVISALVNVTKPYPVDKLEAMELDSGYRDEVLNELKKEGVDGFAFESDDDLATKNFNEILVFEPEQIHILGGKQDIQQAKEFVNKQSSSSEVSGNQIVENIANVTGALSNLGYESILKEFGVGTDGIITDIDGFYQSIIAELKSTGGSQNVIKALESETSIYGVAQAKPKLENIFSSILTKRILKIKTNGGSFIQMSNFGLSKAEAEKQGIIWNPRALKTTHPPQFLKDDKGEFTLSENGKKIIRPGGILLSGSFIAKYIPDYRKYVDKDGNADKLFGYINENGEFVEGVIDRKILENIIGYRIPNQGLSSNDALEIIGILPEENGDTVVAYTGITTKTGSDFDIDKMYLMFPTYEFKDGKLKYENYNKDLTELEQTKGALQNRLIELYKSVLTNENVISEVMTPVDFDHFKKDIRSIVKEKSTTNLSTFNQLDDIDTRYSFLAGKSLVGQEANALMDYVLGSLANANGNNFKITNFNVPKSNEKLDMEYSQKLSDDDLKYYAKQLKLNDDQVKKSQSIKLSHSLSAILNAAVDIAKDPYVTDGNWNTMTTNTGNLLLRKGVHPFYVNALLAQPIIKEYVEFAASYEASENKGLSTAEAIIKNTFGDEAWTMTKKDNVLNDSLKGLRDSKRTTHYDMSILSTFFKYQAASKAIKANIDASKFMVDGVGGSVMSLIMAKNRVDAILEAEKRYYELEDKSKFTDNIILGFRSKFKNPDGSESMFSKYYTNIILKPLEIVKANPKLFLVANETIQNTFNEISIDAKNELLIDSTLGEANLGKQLDKTFYSYVMSGFDSLSITSQERKYLTLKFPKEFEAFKEANKGKYTIVDEITVNQGNTLEFIGLNNRKKSQAYEDLMVGSFLDLLNKDEEFANKLIKYSYLVSGFANNKTQFFSMIPTQWFNRNNINRYIIDKSSEYNNDYKDSNDDNFINQYYLANLEDRKLVKNVSQGQVLKGSRSIHGFVLDKPGKAGYFRVNSDPNGINPDVYYKLIGYDEEYRGVYSRFIPNINDELSEIKLLNVKDKKGNRIINYDTKGINLKPVTETSPSLAKNIDKTVLSKLHNSAIYNRDKFYRENVIINKDEVINVDEVVIRQSLSIQELANLNKGRKVKVNFETNRYNNTFDATVTGNVEIVSESFSKNDITGEISNYSKIEYLELITNTGKLITASESDIKGLLMSEEVNIDKVATVAKSEIVSKTTIQMQPQNVEKILNGTKTTTIRESIPKGGNITVGETKIVNFGGKDFYVTNRGHLTIQEAGGLEKMLKSEGLSSIDDFMYNKSKNWAKGNGKMYVFDIKENFENNLNKPQQLSLFDKNEDESWTEEDNNDTCVPF